ncbi:MAG: hypothetical protein F6K30_25295 [Cyanothece sp. SIO2G6]|nr:hypothetical protein [Cyanothece sp. SIO2G6]
MPYLTFEGRAIAPDPIVETIYGGLAAQYLPQKIIKNAIADREIWIWRMVIPDKPHLLVF